MQRICIYLILWIVILNNQAFASNHFLLWPSNTSSSPVSHSNNNVNPKNKSLTFPTYQASSTNTSSENKVKPASSNMETQRNQSNSVQGSRQDIINVAGQIGNSYLQKMFNSTNKPAWLTRTDIGFDIQRFYKPVTFIETIQPILENDRDTVFWQGRLDYSDTIPTANLGLGYRFFTPNKKWMLGINTFYDETLRYTHKRYGAGAEVYNEYLTLRVNGYNDISGKRYITTAITQQALSGYDFSLETPVPYVSWMRFTAGGYHWEGKRGVSDVNGANAELRVFPARQIEMNVGYAYDNNKGTQSFLNLAYYFGSPEYIQYSATTIKNSDAMAPRNLEALRLEKVRRHNDIVTQKEVSTQTSVIIGRGT